MAWRNGGRGQAFSPKFGKAEPKIPSLYFGCILCICISYVYDFGKR